MNKLSDASLKEVKGGFGFWGFAGIIALGIFVIGIIDGIANPAKCN